MTLLRRGHGACIVLWLAACTPALNWRETSPEGSGVALLFPCRAERHERTVRIGDADTRMQMHSCDAGGAVFSLAFVDVASPAEVAPLLAGMRAAAVANIGGAATALPWRPPGATPNEQTARLRVEGALPGGRRVVEHAAFFARGLRVYQATALGDGLDGDALDTYFGSIKVVP